jgi:hypothetical protein
MALTGECNGPPRLASAPVATAAQGALRAFKGLAPRRGGLLLLDGAALLGERAALQRLARRGAISVGGSCRLLRAADGWLALNLARACDRELLPAWLEAAPGAEDPWIFVAERLRERAVDPLIARARELGLPAAPARARAPEATPWRRVAARGEPRPRARSAWPLVIDLSSLWAGPLAASLLGQVGARVIKVESTTRPDGARAGAPTFFGLMNAGKESVALDFGSQRGRDTLRRLIERADVVIESARPRALSQLGIDAEHWVREQPGRTWLSISGYGRRLPQAHWVAFGDDAAAAAGLAAACGDPDRPVFCADAVADPLAGMHGAVAALASYRLGGGELLDVSLHDVAAHVLGLGAPDDSRVIETEDGWVVKTPGGLETVRPPRARSWSATARSFGADTHAVLGELLARC